MEKFRRNIYQLGKVCGRDIEEIQYVGMQSHGHTHGLQPEAVSWWLIRVSGCDSLQTDHWVIDVLNKYQTRHLFCCEHLKSISCSTKTGSPSSCKTYLKETIDFGLYYDGSHEYRLYGYIDADWAGSILDRKSTLGRCFCLGSAMSSWFSRKQSSVSHSTA